MRTFYFFILILLSGCILAQETQLTAVASPNVLRVGDQFQLEYSFSEQFEDFSLPEIQDFELTGGPNVGHSQNFYSENGKVTTFSSYQYTYFFRAKKEGKFTIPPATTKFKNKVYKSNAVTIEVVKAVAKNQSQMQQRTSAGQPATQEEQLNNNDLFVQLILDKHQAYIGEQIMATVKIYTLKKLSFADQNFAGPEFPGFFTEPIETPPLRRLENEAIDGEIYGTGVLRKVLIIPQKSGVLTIPSFNLDVAYLREYRRRFFDVTIPETEEVPVNLKSKPVSITVKPLPANAPASFKGAVGKFAIQASVSSMQGKTGEPLTFKLTVTGKGNLKLVNEVLFNVPAGIEKYDPVINTRLNNALSGTKTFEYLLIPGSSGDFVIPSAEFTYFDTDANKYTTLKTQSFKIHVTQGKGDSLSADNNGVSKEEVRLLNQDIRYIKSNNLKLYKIDDFFGLTIWYYLIVIILVALFAGILMIRKKHVEQQLDLKGLRFRNADKYARKRLRNSYTLLKQGNNAAFYEELLGAIWNYLSYKLDIPMATLSKDTAEKNLSERNIDSETLKLLFQITDACEMARYGQAGEFNKEQIYKNALEVITTLQQKLK